MLSEMKDLKLTEFKITVVQKLEAHTPIPLIICGLNAKLIIYELTMS
jgi:hypothetical protein